MTIEQFIISVLRGGVRARWAEMTLPQLLAAVEFAHAADEYLMGKRA